MANFVIIQISQRTFNCSLKKKKNSKFQLLKCSKVTCHSGIAELGVVVVFNLILAISAVTLMLSCIAPCRFLGEHRCHKVEETCSISNKPSSIELCPGLCQDLAKTYVYKAMRERERESIL